MLLSSVFLTGHSGDSPNNDNFYFLGGQSCTGSRVWINSPSVYSSEITSISSPGTNCVG